MHAVFKLLKCICGSKRNAKIRCISLHNMNFGNKNNIRMIIYMESTSLYFGDKFAPCGDH